MTSPSTGNREEKPVKGGADPPKDHAHGDNHHAYKILVMVLKGLIGLLAFGYLLQYMMSRT